MIAPTMTVQNNHDLSSRKILATKGKDVKVVVFRKKQPIFTHGNAAGAVFYVQGG